MAMVLAMNVLMSEMLVSAKVALSAQLPYQTLLNYTLVGGMIGAQRAALLVGPNYQVRPYPSYFSTIS